MVITKKTKLRVIARRAARARAKVRKSIRQKKDDCSRWMNSVKS